MRILTVIAVTSCVFILTACQIRDGRASVRANELADKVIYKPIDYENADQKGPKLVVLPGKIKSSNATFIEKMMIINGMGDYGELELSQANFGLFTVPLFEPSDLGPLLEKIRLSVEKMTINSIADYGELELSRANFTVLERSDLGPLLEEIRLAVNLGEPKKVQNLMRGKFKTTKWFVTFDILKAEPVASATTGFDGYVTGGLINTLTSAIGSVADLSAVSVVGSVAGAVTSSVKTVEAAGIWIIGLRYKVVNVNTSEQVNTGYYEEKMEIGSINTSVMGFSQGEKTGLTLNTMIQILVQKAVADLDRQKGPRPIEPQLN